VVDAIIVTCSVGAALVIEAAVDGIVDAEMVVAIDEPEETEDAVLLAKADLGSMLELSDSGSEPGAPPSAPC
jgi:hypothetical protein